MNDLGLKKMLAVGLLSSCVSSFMIVDAFASDSSNRPFRDKWAVVIGVSKFVKPELDLKYADKDAITFKDYLLTQGKFATDHVKLLINEKASRRQILTTLGSAWLSRVAGPDDLVVIYVSSHGSAAEQDVGGVNYLLASDSDPDDLYSSGIDMQALARMIKAKVHSDRVVIFLDTCYSGAGTASTKGLVRRANADAEKIAQSSGQTVIASSLPNQVSWECADRPNSVFTHCLIEGLLSKGGETTLADAFSSLKEKVQLTVLRERGEIQTPVMKGPLTNTALVVAASAVSPQPALSEDYEQNESAGKNGSDKQANERIALLPFEEGDEAGIDMPDYDGLARYLEELVRLRLSNTMGEKLLSPYEVGAALSKTNLNSVWTNESRVALGHTCRAKYLVKVRIRTAHFNQDGSLDFSVSICVASGENGEYVWSGGNKAEAARCEGDSAVRLRYLKKDVIPAFSIYICRAIVAAIAPK